MTEVLWGGRFSQSPHPDMMAFTSSIGVDIRLLGHDLAATRAHAATLGKAGLLAPEDVTAVAAACDAIALEFAQGSLVPAPTDEDVHSFVERELTHRLGELGERIHAGRSRNDLVATDLRLWCRAAASTSARLVGMLVDKLCRIASEHLDTVMPGYTHLQRAQPVSLAFHLAAHAFALERDGRRFLAARESADVSSLGAGALAGTTLAIDPHTSASELGFGTVFSNAMDAVADRDFACDLVYASALCGIHLSRLAEEIVLWTTAEFGFAHIADAWSTGSSMMPQKRNPDVAELVRGRSAGGMADLTGLLVLLKGLPLAYDRDLQEDKGFVFSSIDRLHACLEAMGSLLDALEFDSDRLARPARAGAMWATDLAETLVARGVPFRRAHAAIGALIQDLDELGLDLGDVSSKLADYHPALVQEDALVADPAVSLRARTSHGGTAPDRVRAQIDELRSAAQLLLAVESFDEAPGQR